MAGTCSSVWILINKCCIRRLIIGVYIYIYIYIYIYKHNGTNHTTKNLMLELNFPLGSRHAC